MEWMDRVFHAKFDELENKVDFLTPLDTDKFFFEEELQTIELELASALRQRLA